MNWLQIAYFCIGSAFSSAVGLAYEHGKTKAIKELKELSKNNNENK